MVVCFDVDGVLVEVRESYHQALSETVSYFLQSPVKAETLLKLKVNLNLNNDWDATLAGILFYRSGLSLEEFILLTSTGAPDFRKFYQLAERRNIKLPDYDRVVEQFESTYRKLRFREKLKIPPEILRDIRQLARVMAVITGRIKDDLHHTFEKHSLYQYFDYIITEDDLPSIDCRKPSAYPLRKLIETTGYSFPVCYIGDTLADRQMVDNYCQEEKKKALFILFRNELNQQVKADFYVDSPEALLETLKEVKRKFGSFDTY
ncbi:MAG: HAD hydrolase-like protein [Candidatus Aminicenantes bacterium]|nr:HAD hydrolase-like protein [Candidatus Aminicenantes bacterium]